MLTLDDDVKIDQGVTDRLTDKLLEFLELLYANKNISFISQIISKIYFQFHPWKDILQETQNPNKYILPEKVLKLFIPKDKGF